MENATQTSSAPQSDNPTLNAAVDKMRSSAARLGLDVPAAKSYSESDNPNPSTSANGVEILDAPSMYLFYSTDSIGVRDLRFEEFIPLGAAQARLDARSIAEVGTATVTNYPGMELTFGDYQFLMWYHRTKLMKPHTVQWTCNHAKHVKGIETGEYAQDSQNNVSSIKRPKLKVQKLDVPTLKEDQDFKDLHALGFHVTAPTIESVITSIEERDDYLDDIDAEDPKAIEKASKERDALVHLNKYVVLLGTQHGDSLSKRRDWLLDWFQKYDGDHWSVMYKLSTMEKALNHGVESHIDATCEICGEAAEIEIPFLPASFLP